LFLPSAICKTYSIDSAKVYSIPNGTDCARFFPGSSGGEIVHAFGLECGRYFLSVGRLEPRKNHATMLRAWALLPVPRPRLALVGQRHFRYGELFDLIRSLHLERDVLVLETVSDAQLPAIYRHAKAFVYCSWAEGFGIPLLEAMASGTPVISSPNTSLAEVGGDAVLWADPARPESIASAVVALNQQEELRHVLIRQGFRRMKQFTWEHSAEITRDIYLRHFGLLPTN
jgi:glycosyltransferase involved in cell wall biosynthesis